MRITVSPIINLLPSAEKRRLLSLAFKEILNAMDCGPYVVGAFEVYWVTADVDSMAIGLCVAADPPQEPLELL